MILIDRLIAPSSTTTEATQWHFKMECDKCKAVIEIIAGNRTTTQWLAYDNGWRINPDARKYFYLCKRCADKLRAA